MRSSPWSGLPAPLTPLIGRVEEANQLRDLLRRAGVRFVTLMGAGGVGKTSLAIDVARGVAGEFADGAVLVGLASYEDPDLVADGIALALRIEGVAGQETLETLATGLADKQVLLVLDNLEHLLAAVPILVELLERCPGLTILATSRTVLRASGEHILFVPPLPVPPPSEPASVDSVLEHAGTLLFVERARAAAPGFELTKENAAAVAALCQHLDGIPLAIELGAARVRLLSPEELLRHLNRALSLLTGGSRDRPSRQRTMRDTISWSYDLLSAADQLMLRRLSVFRGGFTLDAANAVCLPPGRDGSEALERVSLLSDHSLVRPNGHAGDDARFGMLEVVREYASERLEADEDVTVRAAHAAYYRTVAEDAELGLKSAEQQRWRDRLEAELDNLRAALAWTTDGEAASSYQDGLRIAGALWYFWFQRGFLTEGRRWLAAVLAATGTQDPFRGKALLGEGTLAWRQGDLAAARGRLEESLAGWGAAPDRRGSAESLHVLGHVLFDQREYASARIRFEESRAAFAEASDMLGGLPLVGDLGLVAYHTGALTEAKTILEESLVLYRRSGLKDRVAEALNRLGDLARLDHDLMRAVSLYEESRSLWIELRGIPGEASALHKLAIVHRLRGDQQRSRGSLADSLALQKQSGNRQGIAECLAAAAGIAAADRQPALAARLLSVTATLLAAIGTPLAPADLALLQQDLGLARRQLDDGAWAAEWQAGRKLPVDEAIRAVFEFLAEPAEVGIGAGSVHGRLAEGVTQLSPREREVATLVTKGLSNRDIAGKLGIAEKTASNHVEHIMTKLDLRSRTQVAVWVVEHTPRREQG